jgi:lipoate-protein ligase A
MNCYIESRSVDPRYNLALEQFVFDNLDRGSDYFMLWQNRNALIVGKNQNTSAEINAAFVKAHNISVVRRLSGGGAVYHDLGNLNFTFLGDAGKNAIDFAAFCGPVQRALLSFGVPAEISGRNDMTVEGKKFSGNAQYIKEGRVMHHGTILYDSDLDMLSNALVITNDKIESKGIKSVKSRIANIRPFMKTDMSIGDFWAALKTQMFSAFDMREYALGTQDEAEVDKLKEQVYSQWSWNYGASPPHNIRKTRRVEGCGQIEILIDVEMRGQIKNIAFYGDFFGSDDPALLAGILKGHRLEYNDLVEAVHAIDVSRYFHNLDSQSFLSLLLE